MMIATPDYGLSDIWHFNYPLKLLLHESLQSGKFPLWSDAIGNGFPIAAEGQIGAFSPLNWIVFGLLPMPTAFMIATIVCFALLIVGSYVFARTLGLSRAVSVVTALFSSVNGYFVVQMTHLNLLQSFSFIPWAFAFAERCIAKKKISNFLWLAMILAQMILVGYPQTFFNTMVLLLAYIVLRAPRRMIRLAAMLGCAAFLAILLSAVQVFPLLQLTKESDIVSVAARQRFIHPLPFRHLLTVFSPLLFGDPSRGTYPMYGSDWGMFWENLLYVGAVPLLAITIGVILHIRKKRSLPSWWKVVFGVFVASVVLSLGKYLPTAVLFKIPPLSLTRISSRFLAFANLFLGFLGGIGLIALLRPSSRMPRRSGFFLLILIGGLHVFQIGHEFQHYHLWVDDRRWFTLPETVSLLSPDSRIISTGQSSLWNKTFLKTGWIEDEEAYFRSRNSLDPNSNLIFHIRQLGVYAQQLPERQAMIQQHLSDNDLLGAHIRETFGVTDIIKAPGEQSGSFEVIPTEHIVADIRVADAERVVPVSGKEEALGIMNQERFDPETDALWESSRMPSDTEHIVIVNRSFYPGWKAYLDDKEIPIYPTNVNQQGVIVPKDTALSSLRFIYDPWTYKVGGAISFTSLMLWVLGMRVGAGRRLFRAS